MMIAQHKWLCLVIELKWKLNLSNLLLLKKEGVLLFEKAVEKIWATPSFQTKAKYTKRTNAVFVGRLCFPT